MADFLDDDSLPLAGPSLHHMNLHGSWRWLVHVPIRGSLNRAVLGEFDTQPEATACLCRAAATFVDVICRQRKKYWDLYLARKSGGHA